MSQALLFSKFLAMCSRSIVGGIDIWSGDYCSSGIQQRAADLSTFVPVNNGLLGGVLSFQAIQGREALTREGTIIPRRGGIYDVRGRFTLNAPQDEDVSFAAVVTSEFGLNNTIGVVTIPAGELSENFSFFAPLRASQAIRTFTNAPAGSVVINRSVPINGQIYNSNASFLQLLYVGDSRDYIGDPRNQSRPILAEASPFI